MYNYKLTPLEKWIKDFYLQLEITEPYQLDMNDIAAKLNIWIYFENMSSRAIERKGLASIIVDNRLSVAEQLEDFGHEMAHILRQSGNQMLLPESFVQFQEVKADNFALEFCIPTFMLLNFSLPQSKLAAIKYISDTFNVTLEFAKKKLAKIERNLLQSKLDEQFQSMIEYEYTLKKRYQADFTEVRENKVYFYQKGAGIKNILTIKEEAKC
ncbi:ImmA/IrrE family metallo-endopeptidase [Tepidibacillus decaturensis]|uniref:ImmA/IrrE family metallo-endopeptidase n=1 Tax=Tepidibacillus decaturensis TaxID=1413211 RepID=UPI000837F7A6|nr:ImmA/IrrE family metallo-endopeptidase [Tepidibacillus decaturensis]